MNIKKLLNNNKKKTTNINDQLNPDIPELIFPNLELQVTIGQWLEILSSNTWIGTSGFSILTHVDADELLKKSNITKKELNEISEKFGILLRDAGIDKDETCIIGDYDREKFSFNCHLKKRDDDYYISLRWGDFLESGPELTIRHEDESRTYDYIKEYEDIPTGLSIQHWTKKNYSNGNSCFRYYSPYSINFHLSNDQYTFTIDIDRPESDKPIDYRNHYKLKNEEELTQYLLSLSFPIKIDEVYKRVCEISLDSIKNLPKLNLTITKDLKGKSKEVTDRIILSHGALEQFIMTKNGRKISIDSDGNWSFSSPKLKVSQNANGLIDFSLNAIQSSELNSTISPMEQFMQTKEEVEGVKVFVKTMLDN